MRGEPKYVRLSDVVSDYINKGNFMDGQTYFNTCFNFMNNPNDRPEVIITEDADFEVIQPKQISNDTKR